PFGRVELVRDGRLVRTGVLDSPDAAGQVALVITAVPVADNQVAVRVENDVAGAEMRIGAGYKHLLLDDICALVGDEPEDGAIGAVEAMRAPVIQEQTALVRRGKCRAVIPDQLRVGAPAQLEAGRGERMPAGQPVVIDAPAAVTMVIDAIQHA